MVPVGLRKSLLSLLMALVVSLAQSQQQKEALERATTNARQDAATSPIVLIPGFAASRLEVKYDFSASSSADIPPPAPWCRRSSRGAWERLWGPPPRQLLPYAKQCWYHKMRVWRNASSCCSSDVLTTRVRPGVAGLDVEPERPGSDVYEAFVRRFGGGKAASSTSSSLLSVVTYDFRQSPATDAGVLRRIRETIEAAYRNNRNRRVTLVTHSYGALLVHAMLTGDAVASQQSWKEEYVHAWIPVAPAYGGVVEALPDLIGGDGRRYIKEVARSFSAGIWMLPRIELRPRRVLVARRRRNGNDDIHYTAAMYPQLFADAGGYPEFAAMWKEVQNWTHFASSSTSGHDFQLSDPHVPVFPAYGAGIETTIGYLYDDDDGDDAAAQEPWYDREPRAVTDFSGDGTLDGTCLRAGNHWSRSAAPLELRGVDHTAAVGHPVFMDYVERIIGVSKSTDHGGAARSEHDAGGSTSR